MRNLNLFVEIMGADCTNRGVTSGRDHCVLHVGDGEPAANALLELHVDTNIAGAAPGYLLTATHEFAESVFRRPVHRLEPPAVFRVRAAPVGREPGMFGGRFVFSSDSRFPFHGPIPVFDRYED